MLLQVKTEASNYSSRNSGKMDLCQEISESRGLLSMIGYFRTNSALDAGKIVYHGVSVGQQDI